MRRLVLIAGLSAAVAASVTFAATGGTVARRGPSYADAASRTLRATSQRFAVDVRITKAARPLALHVRGALAPGTLKLRLTTEDAKAADGTVVPGIAGAVIVDGPFLYERAPSGTIGGKQQWLRLHLADVSPSSSTLRNIRSMTPPSLLRAIGEARMRPTGDSGVFSGRLPYDDPIVRRGLSALTGDIEFRRLRAMVLVGTDGRVHRVRVTGRTADGSTRLRLQAYLYAFDRPVKVKPPAQDAFLDLKREQLSE